MLNFVLLPLAVAIVFGLGMAVLGLRRLAGSVAALAIGVESFDPGTGYHAESHRGNGPPDAHHLAAPVD